MSSLEQITTKLGKAYNKWKEYEKEEKKLKDDFFHAVVAQYDDPLIREEWVDASSEQEMLKIAKKKFPEYYVVSHKKGKGKQYLLTLEENVNYRPFVYVNHEDKMVYKKTIQSGSPLLDDTAIKEEDPDLWMAITREPIERELIPLDELPDDIIARMQKYVYRSCPIVKLDKPRKATEEELEDV